MKTLFLKTNLNTKAKKQENYGQRSISLSFKLQLTYSKYGAKIHAIKNPESRCNSAHPGQKSGEGK
jgi:hypothetical protein